MTKLKGGIMRIYNYKNKWEQFLTPEIVSMLTQIHEFKGKQKLFIESSADALTGLLKLLKYRAPKLLIKLRVYIHLTKELKSLLWRKPIRKTELRKKLQDTGMF